MQNSMEIRGNLCTESGWPVSIPIGFFTLSLLSPSSLLKLLNVLLHSSGADLGGGCRGCAPPLPFLR